MKMTVKEQAATRNNLYSLVEGVIKNTYTTETISDGMLIHLGEDKFAKLKVSICDDDKFDLVKTREKYAERCRRESERAAKKAEKLAEKAAKAEEKTL